MLVDLRELRSSGASRMYQKLRTKINENAAISEGNQRIRMLADLRELRSSGASCMYQKTADKDFRSKKGVA